MAAGEIAYEPMTGQFTFTHGERASIESASVAGAKLDIRHDPALGGEYAAVYVDWLDWMGLETSVLALGFYRQGSGVTVEFVDADAVLEVGSVADALEMAQEFVAAG